MHAHDPDDEASLRAMRLRMVDEQIASRGVADARVLQAMRELPREAFVPDAQRPRAYDDSPLPIGDGQTISQPYIVALMLEAARLQPTDRVLEVGAGSGYAAALAGRLAARVLAIERRPGLARAAAARLAALGATNVEVREGDGSAGIAEEAPFDAILVAASGPSVPAALRAQLADGGRLVIPVGASRFEQRLLRVVRSGDSFAEEALCGVVFVPLVGVQGWPEP